MPLLSSSATWISFSTRWTYRSALLTSVAVSTNHFSPMAPLVGLGLLIVQASRPHSDTPHSVDSSGQVIGPSQRPVRDNTQHSQETDIHAKYINNCPTRWNTKQSIYYSASSLASLATLERGSCTKIWPVPEAVVTVLCTPDDGCS